MSSISHEDLLSQLQWRYATKGFDPERHIPEEVWNTLADTLILTPSSFGLQPWHFIVVQDKELRGELLAQSWGQRQVLDCSHFVVLTARTDMDEAAIDSFLERTTELRGGDLASLSGYRDMMVGFTGGMDREAGLHWAKLQTYIALGQLLTSAAVLGIDACPMEGLVPSEYDRILGLPEKGLTTSVACALGYRSDDDKYALAPKVRFPKGDLLTVL